MAEQTKFSGHFAQRKKEKIRIEEKIWIKCTLKRVTFSICVFFDNVIKMKRKSETERRMQNGS